jgi:UDP-galactopyranose mutase
MNKKYDYLIVGSGLFGATFAYKARQAGKTCLVIDKRPHLGGNVYCENVEGINVHKYGAHIFHTSNKQVWDFVNSIVEFNRYTNSPVANYKGKLYNLPFNMNTFYQMWGVTTPEEAQAKINEQKAEAIAKMKADGVTEPRNLEEQAQVLIGKDIYEKLIKEYTEKQWGRKCTDLPAFIIKRLPVRLVFDNNYFNDKYQGIPIGGYNKLIEGLLAGTDTLTNTDFFAPITNKTISDYVQFGIDLSNVSSKTIHEAWKEIASNLVYTGQLDQYFDYRLGKLDWRTVSFKTRVENTPNYQGNAVVNYTSHDEPYTRVIEHKHFEMFGQEVYDCPKTVVSEEYSTEYKDGMEPYYPVNDDRNNTLADQYRRLAAQEPNVIFGGRLAEYKYYDMAPIIEKVLTLPL